MYPKMILRLPSIIPFQKQTKDGNGSSSLKNLFVRGSAWVILGFGTSQFVRLCSNLLLTRLLFPEAFGLMALVNIFLQGLEMFSVLGIGASIIQSKRGDDPVFLNTSWTIQIIRGFGLWVCSVIIAWPVASFYNQPELLWLLPVAGFTSLIAGFNSTALFHQNRQLRVGKLTIIELSSQVIGIIAMVVWAWMAPSVWALIFGRWFGIGVKMFLSHIILEGVRPGFQWEKTAIREILGFGKWIFLGSALTFLASQGDRLILGKFISISDLGVYAIAFFLSHAMIQTLQVLASKMLFPVYSRLAREGSGSLRQKIQMIRLSLMILTLPFIAVTVIWGQNIIQLLYDSRYHDAGWMLQILGVGAAIEVFNITLTPILLATGDSFRHMLVQSLKTIFLFAAMIAGGYLSGTKGLIIGVPISYVLTYPFTAWAVKKYGIWTPVMDLAGFVLSIILIAGGWVIFN
jgi:O-antigen/teichoic acid export membrane protein